MSIIVSGPSSVEDIILNEGVLAAVTSGPSMRPLFKTHRDMIILERPNGKLHKYDVALYRVGGKYILHRIIGIDEMGGAYIIRGDNTYKKEYIPFDKIIAVLVAFNRKGKRHNVTDRSYRVYSAVWNFIYPIRFVTYYATKPVRRLLGKILPRKKDNKKADS